MYILFAFNKIHCRFRLIYNVHLFADHKCFPGHQPELDLPPLKRMYDSFETTSRVAYQHPGMITARQNETTCIYCKLHPGHVRN